MRLLKIISLFMNKYIYRYLLGGQTIKLSWTILPALILICMALPFLKLICVLDEINNPIISFKTIISILEKNHCYGFL